MVKKKQMAQILWFDYRLSGSFGRHLNDHPSHGSANNSNNKNFQVILRGLTWPQMILVCVYTIYCCVNGGASVSDHEEKKMF